MDEIDVIINKIKDVRTGNNVNWMKILSIAAKAEPQKMAKVFKGVFTSDAEINKLSEKLVKELESRG